MRAVLLTKWKGIRTHTESRDTQWHLSMRIVFFYWNLRAGSTFKPPNFMRHRQYVCSTNSASLHAWDQVYPFAGSTSGEIAPDIRSYLN